MDTHHDFDLWHALYRLEARYWHEVDCNGGQRAHEYYLPDGVMVVVIIDLRDVKKFENSTRGVNARPRPPSAASRPRAI